MKYSREQITRAVGFIFMGFVLFGVDLTKYGLTEDSLAQLIVTGTLVLGMIVDGVGYVIRLSKGDTNIVGRRIET
jgi:hypothetical protein